MESLLVWGIVLLAVSLLLVVIEVFVPSMGVISLVATAVAIAGVVCLFRVDTKWGLAGMLSMLVLGPIVFAFAIQIMPSTPMGKRMLFGSAGEERPVIRDEPNLLDALLGAEGIALTDLRPVGVVRIEPPNDDPDNARRGAASTDQRIDALAEVSYIRAGTRVKITHVEGTLVKVRPV